MPAAKRDLGGAKPIDVGEVEVVKKTDRAILVRALSDSDLNGDTRKTWVAISQVCNESQIGGESDEDEIGRLTVPLWLAESNGWV
jgi:hypothetical protein